MIQQPEEIQSLIHDLGEGIVDLSGYRMNQMIGRGGFGEVWKATKITSGEQFAIKRLFIENFDDDGLDSYIREIRILSKCRYPFLLHLAGFTVSYPFAIITPYISNGSLYEYVCTGSKRERLSPTTKNLIAIGIAYAMKRLHQMNIIHRDLKSPNILLDDQFLPHVCDFGISRTIGKYQQRMTRDCGTTMWMAPEQMQSHYYTNKVDVYSFGVVLYEMTAEQTPFEGHESLQIARLVIEEGKRPHLSHKIGKYMRHLIRRCWAQDPDERPTFEEIYDLLIHGSIMFDGADPKCLSAMKKFIKKAEKEIRK